MLRRRKKDQRQERRAPRGGPAPEGRSRRRARPDGQVPAELRLDARPIPAEEAPVARAARPRRGAEKVVLVTGFDPFGGEQLNPSWEIARGLPRSLAGHRVESCRVPCEFRRAVEVVAEAIERHRPAIVLCLGQAGGRTHLSVERVAINVDDARIDDNAGSRPVDETIAPEGPAAYFSTLPVKAMVAAMRAAGVPAAVSNTAGTYVCNHLMYGVLHFLAASGVKARAGFLHVPYADAQVLDKPGVASLPLATMARGVEAALAAAIAQAIDIRLAEGTLD